MFYLGIDQHAKQLTVNLRDSNGDVVLRRQVSTEPEKVLEFFQPAMKAWFKNIKRKKGSGVARVAVMRRMATIIWHMLDKKQTYAQIRNIGIGLHPNHD